MSGYLLDTHVWYWLLYDDPALSGANRSLLETWQREGQLYLSAISAWEAAQKVSSGKLHLMDSIEELIRVSCTSGGLHLLNLSVPVLIAANRLPGDIHGDPADRILAATAREGDYTLVTHDTPLRRYAKQGHLRVHKV